MGNNSETSCLSEEPHDDAIKDPLVHYFGCTPFDDRDEFLSPRHQVWKDEKTHQKKLEVARGTPEQEIENKARASVEAIRKRWDKSIGKEIRRIKLLRETLEKDGSDGNLVLEVNRCREEWWNTKKPPSHISNPKPASLANGTEPEANEQDTLGNGTEPEANGQDPVAYVPEKDVSVGIIQFENSEPFNEICEPSSKNDASLDSGKSRKEPIWGKFPDQKTNVQSLLYDGESISPEKNLLHKDRIPDNSDRIRYFHIPSNNMIWAEEAISRYFGENRPDFASSRYQLGRKGKTRSSMILQDRYWRGQLQAEEGGPPHARYMSPICETISPKLESTDLSATNMVVFMPYLHWETSKKREYFASEMEEIMAKASDNNVHSQEERRRKRIEARKDPNAGKKKPDSQQDPPMWARAYGRVKTISKELKQITVHARTKVHRTKTQTYDRLQKAIDALAAVKSPFVPRTKLGKYLMAVSKLHEGMGNYRDKMLLSKYLPLDPPLHPRRTLDQAFYWTLRSTKKRDCDQVVYRGTTADPDDFHRFDPDSKQWPKHVDFDVGDTCKECTANIQKLSRVVMVDQLWMWILDSKTIITCFPKRYGANKNDASGIHKSIRSRLGENGSVHSVFELGLVILDECSKTFFDRTKTLDRRPQVINEFARAIGNIMHEQTVAFNRLWWWTEQMKLVYSAKGYTDTSNLRMALLDINPEGRLDREIEDIIEELDIMIHLAHTNNDILKKFVEQAELILNPNGEFKYTNYSQQHPRAKRKPSSPSADKDQDQDQGKTKEEREREKGGVAYRSFKQKANEGQARAKDHIRELEKLRQSAKKTAEDVLHLLSMKQQQASVFQAWQAMTQSDETIKQGQSIMSFTLVTIVFLPLSFLSSIFGMNNKEFGDNNWSVSRQIIYIFSISAGVVFFSLLLAFSSWIRAFMWSLYVRSSTTIAVKSGLYDFYLHRPTERIYEDAASKIYRTKKNRRKEYFEHRSNKRLAKEQEDEDTGCGPGKPQLWQTLSRSRIHRPRNRSEVSVMPGDVPLADLDLENGTPPSANGRHNPPLNGHTSPIL
ncbi:hypothetical protein GGR51DRAFT_566556 [Nemania sp. FL0031]|nr:hypothetical protein GGR51DRAFT_566556 [Nemania sp. FL0031]